MIQYDLAAAKAKYVEAGCTDNEVIAVTMPLKALVKAENGVVTALAARDRRDTFVRDENAKFPTPKRDMIYAEDTTSKAN